MLIFTTSAQHILPFTFVHVCCLLHYLLLTFRKSVHISYTPWYLILSFFKLFLVKFLQITLFLGGLELSFWAKTEFFKILGIWVFENLELSFSVLCKKACLIINLVPLFSDCLFFLFSLQLYNFEWHSWWICSSCLFVSVFTNFKEILA